MDQKTKYAIFDMDGTLLDDDGHLSEQNIQMFLDLKKRGIKAGIATGRPWYMMKREMRVLDLQIPSVSFNGAMIKTKTKTEEVARLKDGEWIKLIELLLAQNLPFFIHTANEIYYSLDGDGQEYVDWLQRRIDRLPPEDQWLMAHYQTIPDWKKLVPIKVIVWVYQPRMAKIAAEIEKRFPCFGCVQSSERMLEVNDKNVSKGDALVRLAKEGHIVLAETVVFGDSHNDLTMFKVAGKAVAMQNAELELKEAAAEVCPFTNNEGVWRYWAQGVKTAAKK